MFKPVNDNVILIKEKQENVTSSGIFVETENKEDYIVAVTNKHTEGLVGKKVYMSKQPQPLGENYYAIDYKDIVAFTD